MGGEMGEPFAKGLLRAAGVEGDVLDLSQKLGGDRRTAVAAVTHLARELTSLKWVPPKVPSLAMLLFPPHTR